MAASHSARVPGQLGEENNWFMFASSREHFGADARTIWLWTAGRLGSGSPYQTRHTVELREAVTMAAGAARPGNGV
jgi:hypothetical protein